MNGVSGAIAGFRLGYLNADVQRAWGGLGFFDEFGRWDARRVRYDLFWALYQGNALSDRTHQWARQVKVQFGLYRSTRHIFNPVHRLGEFWATHLHGGPLDPKAGDGKSSPSALPIVVENDESIRGPIGQLWKDSRLSQSLPVLGRYGAVLGDVAIKVHDDPAAGRVVLKVVHPGTIKWLDFGHGGKLKGYILQELRYDPRTRPNLRTWAVTLDPRAGENVVTYNEECILDDDGAGVTFRTYLNGGLHDWRGTAADPLPPEWHEPFPEVPLYPVQHQPIGLWWGMGEPHALISKVFEVDNTASNRGDYIQKALNAPWFFAGVAAPGRGKDAAAGGAVTAGADPTTNNPEPWRQEMKAIYAGDKDAKASPLVYPLNIGEVNAAIGQINEEVERDYPELQMDIWGQGDTSGRALRIARQRCVSKAQARRVGYDEAIARAQAFGVACGGYRRYDGYDPALDFDALLAGTLDHAIARRPVFEVDPLDDIEEAAAFWKAADSAVRAGCPLTVFLGDNGWGEDKIAELMAARVAESEAPEPIGTVASSTAHRDSETVPAGDAAADPAADPAASPAAPDVAHTTKPEAETPAGAQPPPKGK